MSSKTKNCGERNKELLDLYTQALDLTLDNHVPNAHQAALQIALNMGRPRLMLSFTRAYKIVASLILHDQHLVTGEKCQSMWQEIADMVKFIIARCPGISIAKALTFVLDNGRSTNFFFGERQAEKNIRLAKNERKKKLVAYARRNVA